MDDFLRVMDPNRNGVSDAFTNWGDTMKENFSQRSINQQNTILKGVFSTNQADKQAGKTALEAPFNGAALSGIYDHPVDKPNNYDPIYNPDPNAPGAPMTSSNGNGNSNITYYIIGGSLVALVFLMRK